MPHVFISYAKKDTRLLAEALFNTLNNIPGLTAWMDESLVADESWAYQIEQEIDKADYVVVLVSSDVNRPATATQHRSFVMKEILYAQNAYKSILPVLAEQTKLPVSIVDLQYIDLTSTPTNPDPVIERVCQRFNLESPRQREEREQREAAQRQREAAIGVRPEPVNPYKGSSAFQEADAGNFFGREKLVESLYLKVLEPGTTGRFLVVTGPSGSGKSSVVRAGLIPLLRANLHTWFVTEMTPGSKPLDQLAYAVMRVAMDTSIDYTALLRGGVTGLHQVLLKCLGENRNQMVLVIDQFEELFTLVREEQERQFFLDSLLFALKADNSRLRVIITLQVDFYDRPLMYSGLGELVSAHTAAVPPLTTEELIRVITEPAKRAYLELEDTLVSVIIADVTGQINPLSLLQITLMELYERRAEGSDGQKRKLTTKAYYTIGGVTGALTRKAEAIFTSLTPDEQMVAQQLFLRLITLVEGAEDTRRRVLRTELASLRVDQEHLRTVIDRFGKERLLTFDLESASREPTTKISHEALIQSWTRLRHWLDENRDALRLQRQFAESALQWKANNYDESFLVTGRNLGNYEVLHNTPSVALSNIELDYLTASILFQKRNERARQRQMQLLAGLAAFTTLLAAIAGLMGVLATQARDQVEGVTRNADWTPVQQEFDGVPMVLVPEGCFLMGSDTGEVNEQPVVQQCIEERFWLDKYEVTNAVYGSIHSSCTEYSSDPDQPRVCIEWLDARDFCESRGGRLPTEPEWEFAARGPDGLVYPWGDDFVADNVVYSGNSGGKTAPVGSRPGGISWVGALDLSGNVDEWVNSLYLPYPYDPAQAEDSDDTLSTRVRRSGAWDDNISFLRAAFRMWLNPADESNRIGLRCARSYNSES